MIWKCSHFIPFRCGPFCFVPAGLVTVGCILPWLVSSHLALLRFVLFCFPLPCFVLFRPACFCYIPFCLISFLFMPFLPSSFMFYTVLFPVTLFDSIFFVSCVAFHSCIHIDCLSIWIRFVPCWSVPFRCVLLRFVLFRWYTSISQTFPSRLGHDQPESWRVPPSFEQPDPYTSNTIHKIKRNLWHETGWWQPFNMPLKWG